MVGGLLALALAFALAPLAQAEKLRVAATTTLVADLVREVGGDDVKLEALMGPGVDPHLYKATALDVQKLQSAQVIFHNGLHLEGRMGDVLARVAKRGKRVVAVGERIPAERLLEPEPGQHDPHVWFDPKLWTLCADAVAEALSAADPANAAAYAKRGAAYRQRLTELDTWARERLGSLPEARRILITSHDAYNYFGRAYGVQVVGVQGVSTVSEAGLADIAKTVDFIRKHGVKAIFVETSVSPAAIERISKDSGARVGGELFSDSTGAPGQMETGAQGERYDVGTYEGVFRHNVNTIVEALK